MFIDPIFSLFLKYFNRLSVMLFTILDVYRKKHCQQQLLRDFDKFVRAHFLFNNVVFPIKNWNTNTNKRIEVKNVKEYYLKIILN